jgi:hypothetical protein
MQVYGNTRMVERNVQIAKFAFIAGTVLLLGALAVNLYALSKPDQPQLIGVVFGVFVVGYGLTSLASAFQNRWGRRSDRGLSESLKGLDERYRLYNYRLGADHVLVSPSGVILLVPKYQTGPITYENGKWLNPGARRGILMGLFASDPLGDPGAVAKSEVKSFQTFLAKQLPGVEITPQPVVVFMNLRAIVSAKEAPVTTMHVKQLKDNIRKLPKGATLTPEQLASLHTALKLEPVAE